eukprot:5682322-Alexandrium_andersonii.AAC.1
MRVASRSMAAWWPAAASARSARPGSAATTPRPGVAADAARRRRSAAARWARLRAEPVGGPTRGAMA